MEDLPLFGQIADLCRVAPNVTPVSMYTGFFADFYATMMSIQTADTSWFRSQSTDLASEVLDLCGGSGRLGRAVGGAAAGVVVVDRAPDMLAQARAAARPGERLELVQEDVFSLDLGRRFGRVICGGLTFSMFDSDDRVRILRVASEHLEAGGRVLLDYLPLTDDETAATMCVPLPVPDGTPGFILLAAQRDPVAQVMRTNIYAELDMPGGHTKRLVTGHELRMLTGGAVAEELSRAGLRACSQHDFVTPAGPGAPTWPVRFLSAERDDAVPGLR